VASHQIAFNLFCTSILLIQCWNLTYF